MQRRRSLALLTTGLLARTIPAAAQSTVPFPSKPITLVVPFTLGSGSDTIARIISPGSRPGGGDRWWWTTGPVPAATWARRRSSGHCPTGIRC